jgi:hypothetical protein
VHARLLAAVNNNHGVAYRRILAALELPHDRIAATAGGHAQPALAAQLCAGQLPPQWLPPGVSANSPLEALGLLDKIKPDLIKVDARELADPDSVALLLLRAAEQGVRIFFKRVENRESSTNWPGTARLWPSPHAQGYLWDTPAARLPDLAWPEGCRRHTRHESILNRGPA